MLREYPLVTDNCSLNVAEGPENGPLLVLLHGFTNNWQVFLPILPLLSANWHVLTFDFRGHGKSGRAPS
jgi:non-heme chloroperoxidase